MQIGIMPCLDSDQTLSCLDSDQHIFCLFTHVTTAHIALASSKETLFGEQKSS